MSDFLNRDRELFKIIIVRLGGDFDQGIVNDDSLARLQGPPMSDISVVRILKLFGCLIGTKGQAFRENELIGVVGARTNDEKDGCGLSRFVNQATSNPDSHLWDGNAAVTGRVGD